VNKVLIEKEKKKEEGKENGKNDKSLEKK